MQIFVSKKLFNKNFPYKIYVEKTEQLQKLIKNEKSIYVFKVLGGMNYFLYLRKVDPLFLFCEI